MVGEDDPLVVPTEDVNSIKFLVADHGPLRKIVSQQGRISDTVDVVCQDHQGGDGFVFD